MGEALSLFDKLWQAHEVVPETEENPAVIYIDLHLIHEVTSPQAFTVLREKGLSVARPDRTLGTMDHSTPTLPVNEKGEHLFATDQARTQVSQLERNCAEFGIELHDWQSDYRGIVHVLGPEIGATQPGKTIVCGDSHTSTHGAFGAWAFGIGTTEVGHVLATQTLLQRKPKTMSITVDGHIGKGVTAKDIILAIIGKIGVNGGTGHVIEYRGSAIEGLSMEERMTICNMSIEAGARAGLIAPDETTYAWLKGRLKVPEGEAWDKAIQYWRTLKTDVGAHFDKEVHLNVDDLVPMVTYGTHPGMVMPIDGLVPEAKDPSEEKALSYMKLKGGQSIKGEKIHQAFIGSCTNSRLSDLRAAAEILKGQKVAADVRLLVVPGSQQIKHMAEAEGLDKIFTEAGAQWRESGCSMCIAMNGDMVEEGQLAVSTSNRNFEGRQGKGARTILASPQTTAASAIKGCVADPREFL